MSNFFLTVFADTNKTPKISNKITWNFILKIREKYICAVLNEVSNSAR